MDAAQIVMMPLAGTVPAAASDSSGITPAEQPLTGDFSQILGDALKSVGPSSKPAPELSSEIRSPLPKQNLKTQHCLSLTLPCSR